MRMGSILFLSAFTFLLNACSWSNFPFLYKPDIQQGNVLTQDRIAALKIGMSHDDVNYLLGTPVLTNVIDSEETQYVYTFKSNKKPTEEKKVLLTFSKDRLVQIRQ